MASVSFANVRVLQTYASPHATNVWAYLETQPWRKVQPVSTDGVNNMCTLLNAAKANGRRVSGSYDDSNGMLQTLYMT